MTRWYLKASRSWNASRSPRNWCRPMPTSRSMPSAPPATTRQSRMRNWLNRSAGRSRAIDRPVSADTLAALSLLTPHAVRERAHRILEAGLADRLEYFRIDLRRLEQAADFTGAITCAAYPSLEIPFHSRWRHFVVDGDDRWKTITETAHWPSVAARARAEFDLAIVSVLLDAGAGAIWRYRDGATGRDIGHSEG